MIEDVVYIPFPGITLIITRPISTIGPIIPFERGKTGCYNRCPCRRWVNCNYHNKMKYKEQRGNSEEYWKDIWDYFNNTFKLTIEMPIVNMNG